MTLFRRPVARNPLIALVLGLASAISLPMTSHSTSAAHASGGFPSCGNTAISATGRAGWSAPVMVQGQCFSSGGSVFVGVYNAYTGALITSVLTTASPNQWHCIVPGICEYQWGGSFSNTLFIPCPGSPDRQLVWAYNQRTWHWTGPVTTYAVCLH